LALEFIARSVHTSRSVVLFPGTWNPPTIAHLEIARAALRHAEEVIWILPRAFPHKAFEGATFEARLRMLERITRAQEHFSVAVSDAGLYAEIAIEAREQFGEATDIALAMGRDAAERIAGWDYGRPGVFDEFVRAFRLMVAARSGEYVPARHHADRISALRMRSNWDEVSSSEVRRRIAAGEEWRHLVPFEISDVVAELYSAELY